MTAPDNLSFPYLYNSIDWQRIIADYPPSPVFESTVGVMPRDKLHALQEQRFLEVVKTAWKTPFYASRWKAAGLEPGEVQGLDDIHRIPSFSVDDLRESMERCPPFGDHVNISLEDRRTKPFVLQSSGGTTGFPRPMLYAPREREIISILRARNFYMHGIRPGDIAQVTLSLGLSNAGLGSRESLSNYNAAIPLMTGSGNSTPTRRQIQIAQEWGTTVIIGYPAYLRHLAMVARDDLGVDPTALGIRTLSSHLGNEDRTSVENLWGCPCYDAYGFHEAGLIAAECSEQDGMHIFEDAYFVEIIDPETGAPLPAGEKGNVVVTALFRHDVPIVRYNVNDVSAILPGSCRCGSTMARMDRMLGRSDNMVKLRGVNVFPEAVGKIVESDPRTTKEYLCVVERVGAVGNDEMTVMVEVEDPGSQQGIRESLERELKESLGVRITVSPVPRGQLAPLTGLGETSKIRRLLDKRP